MDSIAAAAVALETLIFLLWLGLETIVVLFVVRVVRLYAVDCIGLIMLLMMKNLLKQCSKAFSHEL